jgi:UDP-2,3-diacylglucosamine hydrolase
MSTPTVYLASDVHLGAVTPDRAAAFVAWLEWAGSRADEIVLNGDVFDFWFEYRHAIPRGHTRVLGALAALVDAGVGVRLMGGNHDWWGGDYLEQEIGLVFHREPVVLDLAGRRTFLAHGDGLGAGDLGYRMLRGILRGRVTRWAFRWLHPDVGAGVATWVSGTEHRTGGPGDHDRDRAAALERWAVARLEASPELDMVVLGHTHIPYVREVSAGRWYLNAGDWVYHHSFAVLEPEQPPRLLDWTRITAP